MAGFLLLAFYIAMAASAFVVELFFGLAGLIPHERRVWTVEASIAWNYTTWLDLAFLLLAAVLIWRFVSIGRRGRFLRCAERFAAGLSADRAQTSLGRRLAQLVAVPLLHLLVNASP